MSQNVIICGVPPVRSIGAGRLAIELERQSRELPGVRLIYASNRSTVADAVRRRRWLAAASALAVHAGRRLRQRLLACSPGLTEAETVILLHPQSIGGRWCLDLIRRRRHPTWIYLLDSSFFCIRSYNHLAAEHEACLRCAGGDWDQAREHNCRPYPAGHDCGVPFLKQLRELSALGKVRFMAQNPRQATLAERHFQTGTPVPVVGMWTVDLAEVFARNPDDVDGVKSTGGQAGKYDVVFHGGDHSAKGVLWALDVARRLPWARFLFPIAAPSGSGRADQPTNCDFVPMTWESGLQQAVEAAPVTLVPSLWSAPVEGALVKSIVVGRAVAAPRVESGYVADLPVGLIRLLDNTPDRSAAQLADTLASGWRPDTAVLTGWKRRFLTENAPLVATMLRAAADGPPRST